MLERQAGLFVVFEGGDGVGKTTQVERLVEWLRTGVREVVRTFEPGDTPVGRRLRDIVLDPATGELSDRAEALLYAADKAQHVDTVIRPALRRGAVVVCDRYVDSMLAYQGAGRTGTPEATEIESIARWATADLRPDLTVVLDVEPGQAVRLKTDRDRVEAAADSFHQRARLHFLTLARRAPDRYLVLDGRMDRDVIAWRVRERVSSLLSVAAGRL